MKIRGLRALPGLALLVLSGALLAASTIVRSAPAQQELTVQPAATLGQVRHLPLVVNTYDPSYVNPFGVTMYGNVDDANGLDKMRVAGAKWVTIFLDWGLVEPVEGSRDWSSIDTRVRNARNAGMNVFVLFIGDPQWAWVGPADNRSTDPLKRRNFVRAMVQRYDCDGSADAPDQLCVRDWSFYAEPDYYAPGLQNSPGAKGYWGQRGRLYAQMIQDVAVTVHVEDPTARVMVGGIAYDYFKSPACPTCPFIRTFLPEVLDELNRNYGGARQYLDAVAVHYYPLLFPSLRDKLREIRSIMQAGNVANLPLLVPETGYWSADDSSETKQAQWLVQLYVEGMVEGVEQLSWFQIFDDGTSGGRNTWGLFRGQDLNSPKPAYAAYATLTRELTGARYLRSLPQAGVAAHVFQTLRGGEKTVAWTKNASGGQVTIPGSCVRITTLTGSSIGPVQDGSAPGDRDGVANGQITLGLAANEPLYIATCQ